MEHKDLTDELSEQLTLLALGALDQVSAKRWEAHLAAGCRVCQQALMEIQSTLALLAYSVAPASPPPYLKAHVFERVSIPSATGTEFAEVRPVKASSSEQLKQQYDVWKTETAALPVVRRRWESRIGIALAMAAVVFGFVVYTNSLLHTISRQQTQIAVLKAGIAHQEEALALLKSPHVTIIIMNGLDPSPQGHGKIMWDSTRKKALLYVTNLPPAPRDKDYQLWQILDNKPVSAGVFNLSTSAGGVFEVEPVEVGDIKQLNAFAVTLEPKGGVPQPTGKMYLLGKPNL